MQNFEDPVRQPRHDDRVEIVKQIPDQHAMKAFPWILHRALKKLSGQHRGDELLAPETLRRCSQPLFLVDKEIPPGAQKVFGGNAIALVHEESNGRLPHRTKIEHAAARNISEEPEKFLESI